MFFTGRTPANPENLIPNSNESMNINLENMYRVEKANTRRGLDFLRF